MLRVFHHLFKICWTYLLTRVSMLTLRYAGYALRYVNTSICGNWEQYLARHAFHKKLSTWLLFPIGLVCFFQLNRHGIFLILMWWRYTVRSYVSFFWSSHCSAGHIIIFWTIIVTDFWFPDNYMLGVMLLSVARLWENQSYVGPSRKFIIWHNWKKKDRVRWLVPQRLQKEHFQIGGKKTQISCGKSLQKRKIS